MRPTNSPSTEALTDWYPNVSATTRCEYQKSSYNKPHHWKLRNVISSIFMKRVVRTSMVRHEFLLLSVTGIRPAVETDLHDAPDLGPDHAPAEAVDNASRRVLVFISVRDAGQSAYRLELRNSSIMAV